MFAGVDYILPIFGLCMSYHQRQLSYTSSGYGLNCAPPPPPPRTDRFNQIDGRRNEYVKQMSMYTRYSEVKSCSKEVLIIMNY